MEVGVLLCSCDTIEWIAATSDCSRSISARAVKKSGVVAFADITRVLSSWATGD